MVASHSWGDNVFRNFLVWIGEDDQDWVEKHVAAYVNIAGPVLGVAKSMTSLLSGILPLSADVEEVTGKFTVIVLTQKW